MIKSIDKLVYLQMPMEIKINQLTTCLSDFTSFSWTTRLEDVPPYGTCTTPSL